MILANQISEKLTFLILGVKFYATRDTFILYENYSKSLKLIISKFHFLIFQANHDGVTSVVDQVILHDSVIFTQNLELEGNRKNPQSHPSRFWKWCWKKWIKLKSALKKIREVSVYFKIGYSCEYDIYILWVKRRYVPFCQGCWRIMEKRRTKCTDTLLRVYSMCEHLAFLPFSWSSSWFYWCWDRLQFLNVLPHSDWGDVNSSTKLYCIGRN